MQKLITNDFSKVSEQKTDNVVKSAQKENIKNLQDQISLKFGSSPSALTIEQQSKIDRLLGNKQIKSRVYFVRHGQSVEDLGNQNLQSDRAELTEEAKQEFENIAKNLEEKGFDSKNTYMLSYDGDEVPMQRIIDSFKIIENKLGIKDSHIDEDVLGLDTTDKEEINQTLRYLGIANVSAFFCGELLEKMNNITNTNLVCIMHKSNIGAIRNYFFKKENAPVDLGHGGFKNGEIQEVDLIQNGDKALALNYLQDKTILNIGLHNCDDLLRVLANENELKGIISQFEMQIYNPAVIRGQKPKLNLWDLQNIINVYFIENPDLFKKYLLCDNHDLRVFCISNFVENGNFSLIDKRLDALLEKESEITILKFVDSLFVILDKEQIEFFLQRFRDNINLGGWLDEKLKEKELELEFYMNYLDYVKPKIDSIRSKTLDNNIVSNGNLISLGFQNTRYNNMEELVSGQGISIIEGPAGSGKSTKLLEIMEYLNPSNKIKIFPIYLNLGKIEFKDIKTIISHQRRRLLGSGEYKFIYLFDALDESRYTSDEIKDFLKFTQGLDGKVIITTRGVDSTELLEQDILKLNSLNQEQIDEYIGIHLSFDEIHKWEEWKNDYFVSIIKDNPLMLSMLIEVIKNGDKLKEMVDLGVLSKKDITIESKMDLYNVITTLRLYTWEKDKPETNTNIGTLDSRKKILAEAGYQAMKQGFDVTGEQLAEIISRIDKSAIPRDALEQYDFRCLNLIRKFPLIDLYEFLHQSFREYFVLLNYEDDKEKWNEKLLALNTNNDDNKILVANLTFIILTSSYTHGVEILEKLMKFSSFRNNISAIRNLCGAIGNIGDERGIELLRDVFKNSEFRKDKLVVNNMSFSLKKIGGDKAMSLISEIMEEESYFNHIWMINFISENKSKKSLDLLRKILDSDELRSNSRLIRSLILTVKEKGDRELLLFLEEIFKLDAFQNSKDCIRVFCGTLLTIGDEDTLKVLFKVLDLENFKNNSEAITYFCAAIYKFGNKSCYDALEKIVEFDYFKMDKDAVIQGCSAVEKIGGEKGIKILEKIIELESFKNSENAISKAIISIGTIAHKNGLALLENIFKLDLFKSCNDSIRNFTAAIHNIGKVKGLDLLEQIIELENFQNTHDTITNICGVIGLLNDAKGLVLYEKIVRLENFKNNINAVTLMLSYIFEIGDIRGLNILKKIIELEVWRNDADCIMTICALIYKIGENQKIELLNNIIDIASFKSNTKAIYNACGIAGKVGGEKGMEIFEKLIIMDGFQNSEINIRKALIIFLEDGHDKGLKFIEQIVQLKFFPKLEEEAICALLVVINEKWKEKGFKLYEKIVELDVFKENPRAIQIMTELLGRTGDKLALVILRKILKLENFENNIVAVQNMAAAVCKIGDELGVDIIVKILRRNIFKQNKDSITNLYTSFSIFQVESIYILIDAMLEDEDYRNSPNDIANILRYMWEKPSKEGVSTLMKILELEILLEESSLLVAWFAVVPFIMTANGINILDKLKNKPKAISNFCYGVTITESERLFEILEMLINLEGFQDNKTAIAYICSIETNKGEIEWLDILDKLVELKGFENNKFAIQNASMILLEVGEKEGLSILKKIIKSPGFQDNIGAIENISLALGKIGALEGLDILDKLVELKGFQNSKIAIQNACDSIFTLGIKDGLPILEKIIDLNLLDNNDNAILNACAVIYAVGKKEGLPILEKMLDLNLLNNDENLLINACAAIYTIGDKKGLKILEKIIKVPGFQNSIHAIENACEAVEEIGAVEGLDIIKEIIDLPGFKDGEGLIEVVKKFVTKFENSMDSEVQTNIVQINSTISEN